MPASGTQTLPLQPGAGAFPQSHWPLMHEATPHGSCPQQADGSVPKQLGAGPAQVLASMLRHDLPSHPGAGDLPHSHSPPTHVAGPAGSCPQHCVESKPKQSGVGPAHVPASRGGGHGGWMHDHAPFESQVHSGPHPG